MSKKIKKIILTAVLICFISTGVLFASPRPANAQWVVSDPGKMAWDTAEKVWNNMQILFMEFGSVALVNGLSYFLNKLAYDAAVYIASGGSGEKPLFDGKSVGDYFASVAKDSLGTAVGEISKLTMGTVGFDLCAPKLPSLLLKIQLDLIKPLNPPKPTCSWSDISGNWDTFISTTDTAAVLKNVGVMFVPGQNTLSTTLELNNRILGKMDEAKRQAFLEKFTKGGWQDIKDLVTGKVKTPAQEIEKSFEKSYSDARRRKENLTSEVMGKAVVAGSKSAVMNALAMFANTLLTQSMDKIMGEVFPGALLDLEQKPGDGDSATAPASPGFGRRAAQQVYSDLLKPVVTAVSNYDPLMDFTVCPASDAEKQIDNCVVDENLAAGIRLASLGTPVTVAEAIKQKYLDGDKRLISSKDPRNGQSSCYQTGYCYSNLVKLRKARILPVGFELAAELGPSGAPWKLKDVVGGFNNCNASGQRDGTYPYCHLIDPNWVLRLPKTQCLAKVYGPTLVSTEGAYRAEICADPVTCISEDETGKCTGGWGYCTREKNIWRIAADKCPDYYNTCLTYKDRANKTADYLRNTANFDSCTASNVGCRPYFKNQKAGTWDNSLGSAIYFNKDAEKCDSRNAGCAELYKKESGLAFNLLKGSSFEDAGQYTGLDAVKLYWGLPSGPVQFVGVDTGGKNAYDGSNAIIILNNQTVKTRLADVVKLEQNTAYTVSVYAKQTSGTDKAAVGVDLYTDAAGTKSFDPKNIIATCNPTYTTVTPQLRQYATPGSSYGRISCSFLTPSQALYAFVVLSSGGAGNIYLDAAQLEEGASATSYIRSGYGDTTSVYLKTAPNYLQCEAGTTSTACSDYALSCKESEVGCEKYTPTTGDPAIAGSITVNDNCPSSCVGYETYKQDETLFEAKKFPNYFIPSTAKTCSAADVGCDEFTNLSDESKEYFTFVRQCIKTGEAEDAVFYTWEGSDTSGYQLKSHRLKTGTLLAGETEPVPAYIVGADPTACDQTIFKAKIGDAKYNPDCREFYNADGKTSYRLLSKTIISTKDCLQYRKTESTQTDCANSGGAWDSNKLHCIYQGYKTDSKTCSSSSSKCRAYSGAASSNMRIVIQDDFESVTANWSGGASSSEALTAGGHSYKVTEKVAVGAAKIGGDTFAASRSIASLVSADSAYTVSFWAKAPAGGDLAVKFSGASKNTVSISGIKGDWRYYEAGLFMTESKIDSAAALWFELSSSVGFYLDNVILKEVSSKLYLIKNSWSTPAACDQTSGGAYLPQAMLGCKEYSDPNKNTFYLKSFSALCRDVAVGCKAYQQTYNGKSEKNELYNVICALGDKKGGDCKFLGQTVCSVGAGRATCRFNIDDVEFAKLSGATIYDYPQGIYKKNYANYENYLIEIMKGKSLATMMVRDESTAEVPADKTVYLVYDKTKTCQSSYLGCSALGQPALYATSTPASASTVYYKNKPDDYSKLLCNTEAEGCESWTSKGGVDYFKSPEKVCEYKESGSSLGSGSSGWFKKGTSDACYKGLLQNGVNGIWRNADTYYDGSVGACSSQYNGCTEFIDPLDTSAANKKGKPYYLVDNTRLQSLESDQTCGGKASLDEGCVLFNKTSDLTLKWDAKASYALAEKQRKLVSPTSYGICNIKWSTSGPVPTGGGSKGGNCLEDSDCKLPAQLQQSGYTYSYSCDKTDSSVKKDSNTILKVTRDRECGEWLTCRSSYSAYDPTTKKSKVVCGDIGLCNKYQSATGGSLTCANFIAKNPDSGKVLTADNYSKRAIGWTGNDYSGYSIGNKYPITDVTFKRDEESGVKKIFVKGGTKNYDLDGSEYSSATAEGLTCRGFPERDSPFPASLVTYDINNVPSVNAVGFKNANICANKNDCECDYTKLAYGNAVTKKYVTYANRNVDPGVCQGGSKDGQRCTPGKSYSEKAEEACGKIDEGGTCLRLQRQDDVIGWAGYCLERDLSTPINGSTSEKACLTWLPQDVAWGSRDIYNQFRTAGYVPPAGGGKYYCLQAAGNFDKNSKNSATNYDNFIKTYAIPGSQPTRANGECMVMNSGDKDDEVICSSQATVLPNLANEFKQSPNTSLLVFLEDDIDWNESFPPDATVVYGKFGISSQSNTASFFKDNVDLIRVKVAKAICGGCISGRKAYPDAGTTFYIRPGQVINYSGAQGTQYCDKEQKPEVACKGEENFGGLLPMKVGDDGDTDQRAKTDAKTKSLKWDLLFDDGEFDTDSENGRRDYISTNLLDTYHNQGEGAARDFCENTKKYSDDDQDSFFLRFNFKNTGEFDNMELYVCSAGTDGEYHVLELEISVRLREICTTVVDVASDKNAAMTNVIWQYNPDNESVEEKKPGTSPYHYNYEISPFGSAASDIAPKTTENWYSYYTVGANNFAGVPWGCTKDCGMPDKSDKNKDTVDFLPTQKSTVSQSLEVDSWKRLSSIFGKVFKVYEWQSSAAKGYKEYSCVSPTSHPACWDSTKGSQESAFKEFQTQQSTAQSATNQPVIYSFNSSKRLSNKQYQLSEAGKVVINDKTNENITAQSDQYLAVMRFYFWADSDRMPIRSINVDWDDGSKMELADGFYKNHKPRCAKTDEEKAKVCRAGIASNREMVCNDKSECPSPYNDCGGAMTVFGNSPNACNEAYFELQHTYICGSTSCSFAPKVTITDNWGVNSAAAVYGGKITLMPSISITETIAGQ